jgi:hypothetical protein
LIHNPLPNEIRRRHPLGSWDAWWKVSALLGVADFSKWVMFTEPISIDSSVSAGTAESLSVFV